MLDRSALRSFRPLVMTPSHDGTFFFNYVASIIQLMAASTAEGMPINFMFRVGDSLVTRVRNHCVAMFLADPQWTHLMSTRGCPPLRRGTKRIADLPPRDGRRLW